MTGNKKIFSSIDSSIQYEITLGDDYHVKVLGKGVVSVLTKQNEKRYILGVLYVPNLRHNMIVVSKWI
jgi:hypothetical protein